MGIPDGVAPRFPAKPTIRQDGDNLVMECNLEAHPLPEITWFRGDKRVEETQRIKHEVKTVSKHKYLLMLTITNPAMSDGGDAADQARGEDGVQTQISADVDHHQPCHE